MSINEKLTSGEEAHDIFRILLAARPAGKQEVYANATSFTDTLQTVFAHDNDLDEASADKKWLTADCVRTIHDIAARASDERLRLVAASQLGYVGLRSEHRETTLKALTDLLRNEGETVDVRWQAMSALGIMAHHQPDCADYVANTLAGVVTDPQIHPELRIATAADIAISRLDKLETRFSPESVDALVRTLKEDGSLKIRYYSGLLLKQAKEGASPHTDKIEPVAGLIESTHTEFWAQERRRQEAEPSSSPA